MTIHYAHDEMLSSGAAMMIASEIRNLVLNGKDWDDYPHVNSDDIRAYYDRFIEFISHQEWIDGCAFDNWVEIDNALEMSRNHDFLSWNYETMAAHFAFNIRTMHHLNSLSLIAELQVSHNDDECEYCNSDFDACCASTVIGMNLWTRNADIQRRNRYMGRA